MTFLARPITPDEVRAYDIAGVVQLRGILDLQTVNSLRRCIDEGVATARESAAAFDMSAIARASKTGDLSYLQSTSSGQHDVAALSQYVQASGDRILQDDGQAETSGGFHLDTGLASRLKPMRRLVTKGALPQIAAALLGSDRVNLYHDQIFVKEPQTMERTAFHQDAGYMEIEGEQCCVLWVPVDPVTRESGTMMYVRASHRDGRLYKPNVFLSRTPLPGAQGDDLPDVESNMNGYDIVHFDVEPGDVLVHHYRTIHGTGGNRHRYQVRRAASIRYCGDDVRFANRPWTPPQTHHKGARLKQGDALGGQDFPVVWRRSAALPDG